MNPKDQARLSRQPVIRRVFILLLFALALLVAGEFIWRGPVRAIGDGDGHDFAMMYSASRVWLEDGNPYAFGPVIQTLRENGGDPGRGFTPQKFFLLYPPTLYVLLAPLSMLSWPAARLAWLVINLAWLVGLLFALVQLSGLGPTRAGRGAMVLVVLAWAPVHTCLSVGQTSVAATACIVLGLCAVFNRHDVMAGALLGLAVAIKPQMGGLFVLYLLLRRHWKATAWASVVVAVIVLIGLVRLQGTAGWIGDLKENLRSFRFGGIGDPSQSNCFAYQLINLHYLLHTFIDSRVLVNALVYIVAGVSALFAVAMALKGSNTWKQQRNRRNIKPRKVPVPVLLEPLKSKQIATEFSLLSVLAVLSLLVVYHRFYDATLLFIPIVWVATRFVQKPLGVVFWVSVIMLLPFLVPGPAMLYLLVREGMVSPMVSNSWWWRSLVMPHEVWALCGLLACLLWTMAVEQAKHREAEMSTRTRDSLS